MYLWLKALHVMFMVTWFAGLFYLPRLFVYHAMSTDQASIERFKIMERKLYYGITTPGGIITILLGTWLVIQFWWQPLINFTPDTRWLHTKLLLVTLLTIYHLYCGKLLQDFKHDRNRYNHVFYRWFNEFPVLILIGVILLVYLKPF